MTATASNIPKLRRDLVIRPPAGGERAVIKDPRTGRFFQVGEQEHFLLSRFDGEQSGAEICAAFEERFGELLDEEELDGLVQMARQRGLLQAEGEGGSPGEARDSGDSSESRVSSEPSTARSAPAEEPRQDGPQQQKSPAAKPAKKKKARQSILYWRKSLIDPDRLFDWMAPKLWFFWTWAFFILSAISIAAATFLVISNGQQLVSYFTNVLRWETAVVLWVALLGVTTCHEFAHGLTCKRYGGEVHEIGFLLMFFMPAFYCNVSDAWLFPEKRKRLMVTLAGGWFELFLWSIAVFVWRLTLQDSLLNYLAWVVLSVTGFRVLLNFNPLIKLDGYYLLGDLLGISNLRSRSTGYVMAHLRWLLWGAPRPERQPRGGVLLSYGSAAWLFSLAFVTFMLFGLARMLSGYIGPVAFAGAGVLGLMVSRNLFAGVAQGEVRNMVLMRHKRLIFWLAFLGIVPTALFKLEMRDRVGGTFEARAAQRVELRAPVAGFLEQVAYEHGEQVSPGEVFARFEIPDLVSRLAQKQAQIAESEAKLRLLETGARPEELAEQRRAVERATRWRDLAQRDLERAEKAFQADLARLEAELAERQAELETARDAHQRAEALYERGTLTKGAYVEVKSRFLVAEAEHQQVNSQKLAREALATSEAEEELARRENELADAESKLALLEAGTRPEEIDAEKARLARLREELRYLEQQQERLAVRSPVPGLVVTPHVGEKRGQYFEEGELIAEVEDCGDLEVEVVLAEQDAAGIEAGQEVALKARALPFETLRATVERIAPSAESGDIQSQVTVYCRLHDCEKELRPGMTGYARIYRGQRTVGSYLSKSVLRWLRTEFWW